MGICTICAQSLHGTGRAESAGVGDTHDRNQNNSVENRRESLDVGELDGDDERGVTRCASLRFVQITVGWHNQPNEEEVDDVENR